MHVYEPWQFNDAGFFLRLEDSRVRQERASKTLINVKAGVEHLADKLQHLKAVRER